MKICICEMWGMTSRQTSVEEEDGSRIISWIALIILCINFFFGKFLLGDWLTELPKNISYRLYRVHAAHTSETFFSLLFFCYFRFLVYTSVYDYFFRVGHDPTDDCFICRVDEFDVFFFKSSVTTTMSIENVFARSLSFASLFILRKYLCEFCRRRKKARVFILCSLDSVWCMVSDATCNICIFVHLWRCWWCREFNWTTNVSKTTAGSLLSVQSTFFLFYHFHYNFQ